MVGILKNQVVVLPSKYLSHHWSTPESLMLGWARGTKMPLHIIQIVEHLNIDLPSHASNRLLASPGSSTYSFQNIWVLSHHSCGRLPHQGFHCCCNNLAHFCCGNTALSLVRPLLWYSSLIDRATSTSPLYLKMGLMSMWIQLNCSMPDFIQWAAGALINEMFEWPLQSIAITVRGGEESWNKIQGSNRQPVSRAVFKHVKF